MAISGGETIEEKINRYFPKEEDRNFVKYLIMLAVEAYKSEVPLK